MFTLVGNYEQGDENRQLGAKLDELKIDIEGDDDDCESGHQVLKHSCCLIFYFPISLLLTPISIAFDMACGHCRQSILIQMTVIYIYHWN